jgi:hypothetical protein
MEKKVIRGEIISPGIAKGTLCFADFRTDSLD